MNVPFLLAGILSLIAALMHGVGGEVTILSKVSADAFPTMPNGDGAQAKAETRMTWHGITVYFALTGGLLLMMAFDTLADADVLAGLITLHYVAWGVLLALIPAITLRDARAALRSPQWALMFVMAALTYGGTLA